MCFTFHIQAEDQKVMQSCPTWRGSTRQGGQIAALVPDADTQLWVADKQTHWPRTQSCSYSSTDRLFSLTLGPSWFKSTWRTEFGWHGLLNISDRRHVGYPRHHSTWSWCHLCRALLASLLPAPRSLRLPVHGGCIIAATSQVSFIAVTIQRVACVVAMGTT